MDRINTLVNINGEILSKENAFISVFDHGFLFGDSVYEVVLAKDKNIFALKEHYDRLSSSASALSFSLPWDYNGLKEEILNTISNSAVKSLIRIIVTRGKGEVNIDPSSCMKPNWVLLARKFLDYPKEYYTKGVKISIVPILRNSKESLNPAIKTGNYLNNILAVIEAKKRGAFDGLMLNKENFICECTTSNFFLVKGGIIKTPSLECGILSGITRRFVIAIVREHNMLCMETQLTAEDLFDADEAFVTSTTKGIMPVTGCNNRSIGNGMVGDVTRELMALYRKKFSF